MNSCLAGLLCCGDRSDRPAGGIIRVPDSELGEFQKRLNGKRLMFAKGFGQNNWGENGSLDGFDGFLKYNDQQMLDQIQRTVRSFGLTAQDYVVIDGDPVNAGFQIFVYWMCKETRCQLIWAKKLPDITLAPEKQQEAKDKMLATAKTWEAALLPFNTPIYFLEITQERQDAEMLKVFGGGILPPGMTARPNFRAPIVFFEHDGELQKQMKKGVRNHPAVEAYAEEVRGYSQKGPMEFCAFENAAKGLVIRSILRPHAKSTLTLLTGGGQASVLEVAACAVLDDVNPDTELAVFPASRGKPETDPKMTKVLPQWA